MAQLANVMGKKDDAAKYGELALAYRKLLDPQQVWTYDPAGKDARAEWKGWFRARDGQSNFVP